VRHQRDARSTSRYCNNQRRQREQRELRPRRDLDAIQQRRRHDVPRQQVADQAEHRPTRAQHRRARPEEAGRHHLRDPRERAHREEEGVEPPARRPAFDQQASQQQREAVRQQMRERAVGVDARHDRPRVGSDRRREHEQPEQADEAGDSLEGEDDHEEHEGLQSGAP